jgi:LppX_LprAFG lipoprotein
MIMLRTIRTRAVRFGLLVFPLILLLCACSGPFNANGGTSTPVVTTSAPTNLPALLPILQKSLQAMQQVRTVHVDIQGKGTIQTSGPLLPAFAKETGYSLRGKADIDIARRDGQLQVRLKLKLPQTAIIKVAARFIGSKLYLQAPTRQWFVLDITGVAALLNATGLVPQPQALAALLANVKVTDHGMMTIAGMSTHHITLSIDAHALGQLAQQSQAKQVLAGVQLPRGLSADLFIDAATSRLVRLEIKGSVRADVDALLAATGQESASQAHRTLMLTFDLIFTFSGFNQPVPQVKAPPSATPINLKQFALL